MKPADDTWTLFETRPGQIGPVMIAFLQIGRLHITAIAAMGVFTFGWLLMGRYPWLLTAVCAFDWFIVNLINRIADVREDRLNSISGTRFVRRHRQRLLWTAIGLLGVSLGAIHLLNPAITGLRIGGHLLGFCYNWPLLPGRKRLKQLYFWKNFSSGTGFLVTVFGYPLATILSAGSTARFPAGITWPTVLFTALFFLLFIQSYEIIYDLRDVTGDRALGIKTYPAVHGVPIAARIIDTLIFSAMAVLVAGYGLSILPWRIFIMVGAPVLQLIVYRPALRRGITAADCRRLTWLGALLLLVYHLWIFAGLPGSGIN